MKSGTLEGDWIFAAPLLLEMLPQPTIVLDSDLRVRAANSALERLVGWVSASMVDRSWLDECLPLGQRALARDALDGAIGGRAQTLDLTLWTQDHKILHAELELKPAGGAFAGVIVTVLSSRPARPSEPPVIRVEAQYDISVSEPSTFGMIERAWLPNGAEGRRIVGQICYSALFQRQSPCPGCPVRRATEENRNQIAVLRKHGGYLIVTAQPLDRGRVRVNARRIDDSLLSLLIQAKLDGLAEGGRLSERECKVLELLILGRSLPDIAKILEITVRTVKYHQSNVLRKLGADSRVDLVRLLL